MDLNFSQESFAFSDIAPPSHVSGLGSFSDFDASGCSEVSFADVVQNQDSDGIDEAFFDDRVAPQVTGHPASTGDERSMIVFISFHVATKGLLVFVQSNCKL